MKVLLVNGSPHRLGNTHDALQVVAKALRQSDIDTEIFWIGNKPISGCIGCYQCFTKGQCVIDDCVNEFNKIAADADGFVFGTPVHYAGISGSLTSFMDRVFYSGGTQYKFKPAASVITARRAGTTATYDQLNKYYGINQMPIISTRYWNMAFGRDPGEVYQDEEGIQTLEMLGKNMAYYLKCIEAGKAAGILPPQHEATKFTNFVR